MFFFSRAQPPPALQGWTQSPRSLHMLGFPWGIPVTSLFKGFLYHGKNLLGLPQRLRAA